MSKKSPNEIITNLMNKLSSEYNNTLPLNQSTNNTNQNNSISTDKLDTERVINYHGSSAGASSQEFDIYRNQKKRERERIEQMELEAKEEEDRRLLTEKIERNRLEADERTRKNAEKRKKKKEKVLLKKSINNNSNDNKNDDLSDNKSESIEFVKANEL